MDLGYLDMNQMIALSIAELYIEFSIVYAQISCYVVTTNVSWTMT